LVAQGASLLFFGILLVGSVLVLAPPMGRAMMDRLMLVAVGLILLTAVVLLSRYL
jgi:hypothetical protein